MCYNMFPCLFTAIVANACRKASNNKYVRSQECTILDLAAAKYFKTVNNFKEVLADLDAPIHSVLGAMIHVCFKTNDAELNNLCKDNIDDCEELCHFIDTMSSGVSEVINNLEYNAIELENTVIRTAAAKYLKANIHRGLTVLAAEFKTQPGEIINAMDQSNWFSYDEIAEAVNNAFGVVSKSEKVNVKYLAAAKYFEEAKSLEQILDLDTRWDYALLAMLCAQRFDTIETLIEFCKGARIQVANHRGEIEEADENALKRRVDYVLRTAAYSYFDANIQKGLIALADEFKATPGEIITTALQFDWGSYDMITKTLINAGLTVKP